VAVLGGFDKRWSVNRKVRHYHYFIHRIQNVFKKNLCGQIRNLIFLTAGILEVIRLVRRLELRFTTHVKDVEEKYQFLKEAIENHPQVQPYDGPTIEFPISSVEDLIDADALLANKETRQWLV